MDRRATPRHGDTTALYNTTADQREHGHPPDEKGDDNGVPPCHMVHTLDPQGHAEGPWGWGGGGVGEGNAVKSGHWKTCVSKDICQHTETAAHLCVIISTAARRRWKAGCTLTVKTHIIGPNVGCMRAGRQISDRQTSSMRCDSEGALLRRNPSHPWSSQEGSRKAGALPSHASISCAGGAV